MLANADIVVATLVGFSPFCLAREPQSGGRESQAVCRHPKPPLSGEDLLQAVTDAMVALHERYHHRKPVTAKTLMLGDDLLACVLGGVYTDVEKTMIELQRTTIVQETRNAFQNAMQQKFIDAGRAPIGPRRARVRLQSSRRPGHRDRDLHAHAVSFGRRRGVG